PLPCWKRAKAALRQRRAASLHRAIQGAAKPSDARNRGRPHDRRDVAPVDADVGQAFIAQDLELSSGFAREEVRPERAQAIQNWLGEGRKKRSGKARPSTPRGMRAPRPALGAKTHSALRYVAFCPHWQVPKAQRRP